jgi:hypothetical protein
MFATAIALMAPNAAATWIVELRSMCDPRRAAKHSEVLVDCCKSGLQVTTGLLVGM